MNYLHVLLFSYFLYLFQSQLLLDGIPFQFQLGGPISYTPTSGGIDIPGYILRIGYTKHQWIGVKFMTLTSNSNYDVLIFKRSTTSNGGYYQCSVSDYYVSSGRQNVLMADTINNMDKQVTSQSSSNHFQLQLYRTRGTTNGQDWQGGQFVKICFFTSDVIFNKDNWVAQYQTCYGFNVANYWSTWLGFQINGDAVFDGVNSKIYGGISGPKLKLDLYVFRPNANLTGSQITIRIGSQISEQVGYDFQKCLTNKGDYFGHTTADLNEDLIYSGYNDNQCQIVTTTQSLLLYFGRYLNTYDDFDNKIGQNTQFCFIVGSNQNCHLISPQITFPVMSVQSAIKIYANNLLVCASLMILIFLFF